MEITESQFEKIKHLLPRQRGNVKHDSRTPGQSHLGRGGRKLLTKAGFPPQKRPKQTRQRPLRSVRRPKPAIPRHILS